jgi:ketosteroid isomerase-like protein
MLALPNVTATWAATYVEAALSGDLAYEIGTYALAFDTNDARAEDHGKYVVVWRKDEGAWKIVADVINSDKPIAAESGGQ